MVSRLPSLAGVQRGFAVGSGLRALRVITWMAKVLALGFMSAVGWRGAGRHLTAGGGCKPPGARHVIDWMAG